MYENVVNALKSVKIIKKNTINHQLVTKAYKNMQYH